MKRPRKIVAEKKNVPYMYSHKCDNYKHYHSHKQKNEKNNI